MARYLSLLLLLGCATTPAASPAPDTHRIAAVQYRIRAGRTPAQVLATLEDQIRRAAAAEAELVVLPELFLFDVWADVIENESAYVREVARDVTPKINEAIAAFAKEHSIAILVGSAPELRDGRLYNTARLFFADGRVVVQDKVFLTAWGKKVGMTPGAALEVFDAPWGRSVILVCYDVEIPALSNALVAARPEVFLVPSMTESEHGFHRVRWAAQARAIEHHAYVVVAGTVGRPSPSWAHFGQAAFLTPHDRGFPGLLAEGPRDEEAIVFGDLDLGQLRASRDAVTFYPAKDQTRTASVAGAAPLVYDRTR